MKPSGAKVTKQLRTYVRGEDRSALRSYKRRCRPRFGLAQRAGIMLIIFGVAGLIGVVQSAHGGAIAFLVLVFALGAGLLVPIPIIPTDWRDDD